MKKRITAAAIAAAMTIAMVPAFAADNMESTLVAVRSRIDIPQELTEFRSGSYSDDDGTQYMFTWSDKDNKNELTVMSDNEGHISSYSYYIDTDGEKEEFRPREEYYAAAESFLKKAAPELFGDDNDRLVKTDRSRVIRDNTAVFSFERQIGGIPVVGNDASVSVKYKDGGYTVTSCNISWDYKTQVSPEGGAEINAAEYYKLFPLEMVYRKPVRLYFRADGKDGDKTELIYRYKDNKAGYMSVYTNDEVKPDNDRFDRGYASAKGGGEANTEDAAVGLTPQEIEEINNVSGLKSADEIISSLEAMNVFGKLPAADKYSKRTYKQGGRYFVSLDYNEYKDMTETDDMPMSVYITADGQTGELIRLSSYRYNADFDKSLDDAEKAAAEKKIGDFLGASFGGKLSECGESEDVEYNEPGLRYPRLVNGVKYVNNYLEADYDIRRGIISNFIQVWDDDVSAFADPARAIDAAAAQAKMEELAPVHTVYVKSGDVFRSCYTSGGAITEIDAVSGEEIKPRYSYDEPEEYGYSDISGHWAESAIKAVSQYGAGLPGEAYMPDKAITQGELVTMLSRVIGYGAADIDTAYRVSYSFIRDDEKAPESTVPREDAFVYLIRLMGYEKIASMDIFIPGFTDGTDISPDKAGALAILRGYGIVEGDNDSVRPKDDLTRAEAAALIYNYLNKE